MTKKDINIVLFFHADTPMHGIFYLFFLYYMLTNLYKWCSL